MYKITELKLHLNAFQNEKEALYQEISKKLGINKEKFSNLMIVKKSIDARKADDICFQYQVLVNCSDPKIKKKKYKQVSHGEVPKRLSLKPGVLELKKRPIVIGFGPAGMFAALLLAQHGYCPLVLERGEDVDERTKTVDCFWKTGQLDENSNVQFGEGGAGTFSDGKLTARSKDERITHVLLELIEHGAPESILYDAHPHIGTDRLKGIVKSIRNEIISLGGEVRFNSFVKDFKYDEDTLTHLLVNDEWIEVDQVIMAVGHSARDTFKMLNKNHVCIEAKPFSVGLRVEHPQSLIDKSQYHEFVNHPMLGSASYRLTHQATTKKGVYTFCMCPGGYVVPAASCANQLVVNGMSEYARDGENANSAILVQVNENDYGPGVLAGMYYQEALEKKAFELGGSNYCAPVQLVKDFLLNQVSTSFGTVKPSYTLHTKFANLQELFSPTINETIKQGLLAFDHKIHGFTMDDAVLTGVESRSSSPIRIVRNQSYQSLSLKNLYPCGEGAGYAGGIVSSAIDGVRCAQVIIELYEPFQS